jgi:uncharacterized protein (DUF58 family)
MTIIIIGLTILGLVFLQAYIYKRFWRHGLSTDVRFSAKEAFEGDSLLLLEEFTNKKLLPLPWLFVKFRLSKNLVFKNDLGSEDDKHSQDHSDLFSIGIYKRIRRKLPFICAKRGFYTLRELSLRCANLLHTRHFEEQIKTYGELTVFPKLLDDEQNLDLLYKSLDATILSNALINPDPFEFKGIRDYMPTDSLKDINFKATAIGQQLMVNIHAPVSAKRLEIILNLEPYAAYSDNEVYEQGIRLAATAAARYINQDMNVGFYTNGRDNLAKPMARIAMGQSTAHLHAIFTALAHINLYNTVGPMAPYLEEMAQNKLMQDEAVYLIISSYYGDDLAKVLQKMKQAGISAMVAKPGEEAIEWKTAN